MKLRSDHWPHYCGYGDVISSFAVTVCPRATSTIGIECTSLLMCDQQSRLNKADVPIRVPLVCVCRCGEHPSSRNCFSLCRNMELDRGWWEECIERVHIAQRIAFLAGLAESVSHNVSCGGAGGGHIVWYGTHHWCVCVCVRVAIIVLLYFAFFEPVLVSSACFISPSTNLSICINISASVCETKYCGP